MINGLSVSDGQTAEGLPWVVQKRQRDSLLGLLRSAGQPAAPALLPALSRGASHNLGAFLQVNRAALCPLKARAIDRASAEWLRRQSLCRLPWVIGLSWVICLLSVILNKRFRAV